MGNDMNDPSNHHSSKKDIELIKSFVENLTQDKPRPSIVSVNPTKQNALYVYKSKQFVHGNLQRGNPLPSLVKGA